MGHTVKKRKQKLNNVSLRLQENLLYSAKIKNGYSKVITANTCNFEVMCDTSTGQTMLPENKCHMITDCDCFFYDIQNQNRSQHVLYVLILVPTQILKYFHLITSILIIKNLLYSYCEEKRKCFLTFK